jgi:flagellar hook assembly protein FlgD
VQGADRSGNLSGSNVYKIDFDIINKSMISNILNYPNPFSTATRFVFTLTGDQIPTYFKIQIMTITGKIVREITEAEIGPLHIGTNITQYAWDGTDQFGDRLANGIYLYHVTATINGQSIDHYTTGADSYFTKGWGKMYLMR